MKILYLINDITMPGGLSRVTMNLVDEFASLHGEYQVHALSAAAKFDKVEHSNIDYLDMPALHGLNAVGKLSWYSSLRDEVETYVNEHDYQIVIAVGTAMTLFASFCRFHKARLWGAEHLAHNHYGVLRKVIKRWRYPKLERLICLTHADKHRYYDKYLKNVAVIPNFTNFSSVNVEYSNNQKFLFVGRYNEMKGIDYLVDIIKLVHEQCSDWVFTLYGEGEKKSWLLEQVEKMNLNHVVHINEPTDDISKEYQQSGIYILTSRNEGFPMVLLEAQAHGLPIVSFDCETGPSEIIQNGKDGYLVSTFDTKEFADKLIALANDSEQRRKLSQNAFKNRQRFSKTAIIELWKEQFRTQL